MVVVVQLLSCIWLFGTPRNTAHQAPLSFTISQNLLKFIYTESVMLPKHLILCHPLLLFLSVFPSIGVFFPSELALHSRWSKYGHFSFSPSNEYSGWFPLGWTGLISLYSKGLSRVFSSTTIWKYQFFGAQPSFTSIPDYWKNHSFDYMDLCQQSDVSAFNYTV